MIGEVISAAIRKKLDYIRSGRPPPKIKIILNSKGYERFKESMESVFYVKSNPGIRHDTICGYPYEINPDQIKFFTIVIIDE